MKSKIDRINSIDFLRFLLSCVIILHHYQQALGVRFDHGINFFGGKVYFGYAVEGFFELSGFLAVLMIKKTEEQSFSDYLMHKIKRFFPLVLLSVSCYICVVYCLKIITDKWITDSPVGLWRIWNSYFLTYYGGPVKMEGIAINNPLWYLGVLLTCYVIFYLLVQISKKTTIDVVWLMIFMSMLGLGIKSYAMDLPWLNSSHGRGYAAFFLGGVVAYIWKTQKSKIFSIPAFYAVIVVVCTLSIFIKRDILVDDEWGICTYIFFPALIMLLLCVESNKLKNNGIRTRNGEKNCDGRMEFIRIAPLGMYIWHSPFLMILKAVSLYVDISAFQGLLMVLFVFFMMGISFLSYKYVEVCFRKWLENILGV